VNTDTILYIHFNFSIVYQNSVSGYFRLLCDCSSIVWTRILCADSSKCQNNHVTDAGYKRHEENN